MVRTQDFLIGMLVRFITLGKRGLLAGRCAPCGLGGRWRVGGRCGHIRVEPDLRLDVGVAAVQVRAGAFARRHDEDGGDYNLALVTVIEERTTKTHQAFTEKSVAVERAKKLGLA